MVLLMTEKSRAACVTLYRRPKPMSRGEGLIPPSLRHHCLAVSDIQTVTALKSS